jgi:hypothetical protein
MSTDLARRYAQTVDHGDWSDLGNAPPDGLCLCACLNSVADPSRTRSAAAPFPMTAPAEGRRIWRGDRRAACVLTLAVVGMSSVASGDRAPIAIFTLPCATDAAGRRNGGAAPRELFCPVTGWIAEAILKSPVIAAREFRQVSRHDDLRLGGSPRTTKMPKSRVRCLSPQTRQSPGGPRKRTPQLH